MPQDNRRIEQRCERKAHAVPDLHVSGPSIEERLREVAQTLWLVSAACKAPCDDVDDAEELHDAIAERARAAVESLYWVQRLPGIVANLPAPDDDQLGGGDLESIIAARMREAVAPANHETAYSVRDARAVNQFAEITAKSRLLVRKSIDRLWRIERGRHGGQTRDGKRIAAKAMTAK